jgi:hypothetical protein
MAVWTDELKEKVKTMYLEAEPTAETSTEIVKDIAEEIDQSPNGVRQVLVQAGVYVKKDPVGEKKVAGKATSDDKPKRVSKEVQFDALRAAIVASGSTVDEDIITKLTGKAAAYFTTVLTNK